MDTTHVNLKTSKQLIIWLTFGVIVIVTMLQTVGYIASPFNLSIVDDPFFFLSLIIKGNDDLIAYGDDVSDVYYVVPVLIYKVIGLLNVPMSHFTFVWYFCWLMLGLTGYFLLISKVLEKEREGGEYEASIDNAFACSVFAVFNFFVISRFEDCFGFIPHLIAPWLLLSVVLISMKRVRLGVVVLLLASQFNTTQLTYNSINLLLLGAFAFHYISWRASVVLVIASIASSFWLWGSVIYMAIAPSAGLSFSATNEDFLFYGQHSTILEILSLSGNWADITRATNVGDFIYGKSLARITLLLPLVILLWSIVKEQAAPKFYLLAIGIIALIAVGAHSTSPLGPFINTLGYEFFPIMIFRNTQKFVGSLVIFMAVYLALSMNARQRLLIWLYSTAMVATVIFVGVHPPTHQIKGIPQYWQEVHHHVESISGNGNILLLPFAPNNHYDWNAYNAFRYAIPFRPPQPVLFKSLSHPNNFAIESIERKMATGSTCDALDEHDVYLVIERADIIANNHVSFDGVECITRSTGFGQVIVHEVSSK